MDIGIESTLDLRNAGLSARFDHCSFHKTRTAIAITFGRRHPRHFTVADDRFSATKSLSAPKEALHRSLCGAIG